MPEVNTALLIALMPAVVGFINFIKSFGLTGKWLTVASMLVGIGLALAAQLLPAGTFQIAYNGLILGLAASGLYDLATLATSRSTPDDFVRCDGSIFAANVDSKLLDDGTIETIVTYRYEVKP